MLWGRYYFVQCHRCMLISVGNPVSVYLHAGRQSCCSILERERSVVGMYEWLQLKGIYPRTGKNLMQTQRAYWSR
jgi:hypothetical protein